MLQALVAEQREWKEKIIIICKNRSVPFHKDHLFWLGRKGDLFFTFKSWKSEFYISLYDLWFSTRIIIMMQ